MSADEARYYLGVDLGGTKIAVSLWSEARVGAAPVRVARETWATMPDGPDANIDRMVHAGELLLRQAGVTAHLAAIGISGVGPSTPCTA